MLTHTLMGALALSILWVNTLLVAGAAVRDLSMLRRLRARVAPLDVASLSAGVEATGTLAGRVAPGGEPLAVHQVEQVGRLADASVPTILWHDRAYRSAIHGGRVEVGGASVEIEAGAPGSVWPNLAERSAAAAITTSEVFDHHVPAAKKAKGTSRVVETRVEPGQAVWVFGKVVREGEGAPTVRPPDDGELIVSLVEPRAWCRAQIARVVLFIIIALALASACTAVALTPPAFGPVSTVGGALCLAYFLLIQPAGVSLRERVRSPDRAILRGEWRRSAATAGGPAPTGLGLSS